MLKLFVFSHQVEEFQHTLCGTAAANGVILKKKKMKLQMCIFSVQITLKDCSGNFGDICLM